MKRNIAGSGTGTHTLATVSGNVSPASMAQDDTLVKAKTQMMRYKQAALGCAFCLGARLACTFYTITAKPVCQQGGSHVPSSARSKAGHQVSKQAGQMSYRQDTLAKLHGNR